MFLRFLTLDRGNPPPWTDFSVMIYQRKRFDFSQEGRKIWEGRSGRRGYTLSGESRDGSIIADISRVYKETLERMEFCRLNI